MIPVIMELILYGIFKENQHKSNNLLVHVTFLINIQKGEKNNYKKYKSIF